MANKTLLAHSNLLWLIDCEWDEHRLKAGLARQEGRLNRIEEVESLEGERIKLWIHPSLVKHSGRATFYYPDEHVEFWIVQDA